MIATGTAAAMPPIDGLAEAAPWTNREATTAKRGPGRLLVLGGGVVGVELAQAWASLGLERRAGRGRGRGCSPTRSRSRASRSPTASRPRASRSTPGVKASRCLARRRRPGARCSSRAASELRGDELLVAVGRRPRTDELGLETVGVEPGGYLEVDDRMRVGGRDWLYAIGDVNGRALLTHMGKYQARIAADVILGRDVAATARQARLAAGRVHRAAGRRGRADAGRGRGRRASTRAPSTSRPRATPAPASSAATPPAPRRLVVDEERGVIVGATFVGPEIAESLHAATIAVAAEVPLERLCARGARVPDPQRDLAEPAREVRALARRASSESRAGA